jgi:uncharacterized Fe-S cluster protein YjdI
VFSVLVWVSSKKTIDRGALNINYGPLCIHSEDSYSVDIKLFEYTKNAYDAPENGDNRRMFLVVDTKNDGEIRL